VHEAGPLDAGFRPARPGIENPVVVQTPDGAAWVAVYHVYVPGAIGVSYSRDGVNWTRQQGDLILVEGDEHAGYCSKDITTVNGLVPEPRLGKGVYSVMYTAGGGGASKGSNDGVICRGYIFNTAEAETSALAFV